jgi:XTP/dITP diphosphohydrolase
MKNLKVRRLLVATRNKGKVKEISEIFRDLEIQWLSLDELEIDLKVDESGMTFKQNAKIKATAYAPFTDLITLADDSGLEVDALGGRPGVHTARYGGEGLSPVQRYELLLEELRDVPWECRNARFRCVVALAGSEGLIGTAEGICEGKIALEPAGSGGFGYDPVFYLPGINSTMAQLPAEVKNQISHRGKALVSIAPLLREVLGA